MGGHFRNSRHMPFDHFDVVEVFNRLKTERAVVFHCMKSQARGPMCAREYGKLARKMAKSQDVYLLSGGFEEAHRSSRTNESVAALIVRPSKNVLYVNFLLL